MSGTLLARLHRQAGALCGFCRTSSRIIGQPLTVEHIIPRARGGSSDEENLWLSCRRCNEYKGAQIEAVDPRTGQVVSLFNPRRQSWNEHFAWSGDGARIIGLTSCGRATVNALQLNNDDIVAARLIWVAVGWHPPQG
ncbi:MAG: HNH endonuclease [Chloroflexi bacterium]|nr:HNH endonuclease [Chloroflexota bacterium]